MKNKSLPFVAAFCFAGAFIAAKYTILEFEPFTISFLRHLISISFLAILMYLNRKEGWKMESKDILWFFLAGFLGVACYHWLFLTSLKYTLVGNTSIINASIPIVMSILAAIFLHERLTLRNYFGVVLAFIGVLLIVSKGSFNIIRQLQFNHGDLLMVAAVFCTTIHSIIIKKLSAKYHGTSLAFYTTFFGIILLTIGFIYEGQCSKILNISTNSIWALLYMGIVPSGIGYIVFNTSLKIIGPTKTTSIVYSAIPIIVIILAFLFFGEVIPLISVGAVVLIILGVNSVLRK